MALRGLRDGPPWPLNLKDVACGAVSGAPRVGCSCSTGLPGGPWVLGSWRVFAEVEDAVVELCPRNSYVEILTPRTSECNLNWK